MLSRKEWEFPVNIEEAREMMAASLPGKVVKTRYYVRSGKHLFEVDVFHDKNEGLVLAEIELSHPDEHFLRPAWLGEEVTGNPTYYNSNLIK
jgi:CYTH domain-containing protein